LAYALEIRGVTAGYDDLPVVHDFSASIEAGTVTTLIGGNGAGKSTLMRALYGTCRLFAGEIMFLGRRIERMQPWARLAQGVGFVPQGRCNFSSMRVAENFKMACYSMKRADHEPAIIRTLDLFPALKPKMQVMAGNLSGGEQQMLEMAMVMVLAPKLLLLDEPSLGLSPKMQQDVFAMARQVASTGVTVLMVEQNAHGALLASDAAIVLELGRNVLAGPAQAVIHDPRIRRAYLGERVTEPST
jgi:branched-chain amino acid transport system ATP-binding protein